MPLLSEWPSYHDVMLMVLPRVRRPDFLLGQKEKTYATLKSWG